ncbi:MAG: C_GCAxxG_C_C family protein [Nitrospiraceae bacterium]|nr:MAG: C_GCAxxG_C_C family protein [Nitrospiraceae bacterium]
MSHNKLSRRELITATGAAAIGAALAQLGGGIVSKAEAKAETNKWPWPYEKLDPAKTAELAYNEWYRVFCGAAVISSVFSQLAEKIGEPYKSFPVDPFIVLEGGMAGWGTICGSVAGANIASNLIIGPRIAGPDCEHGHTIGSNIMQWYSEANLPVYVPKTPKANKEKMVRTTSSSPLCHISVGRWMEAANKPLGSPERKDRCARVAASAAYKLVEDLNAWKDGKYKENVGWVAAKSVGITGQQNCTDCHGSNIPTAPK